MFDVVRNNKKIVQIFLALITLPFAFFGIDSYMRTAGSDGNVATIGGDIKISQQQFLQTLREQQDRLRTQLGGQIDAKLFDTPEARKAILDDMINQRLLMLEASKKRMYIGNDAIRRAIVAIDAFKVDGKFSAERYEAALRAQGMSPVGFESQLRQDLTLQQLAGAVGQSGLVARSVGERILALQTEKREVMEYRIGLESYLEKVRLPDDAARRYYDGNSKKFETPEQARAEYVVLSMDAISALLTVSDAEIKAWYESHRDRFQQPEERRASHILVASEKIGKDKAKAKAELLLQEVRNKPMAFAELAKKNSDDPGSAAKGGDLGFFGRGMMVKSFEESVFNLKENAISDVVESDFGYHIIKLTGIHAAKEKPLADVRGEIEAELKKTGASRKFAEAAETFSNMVYEQSDSLKPVAEKFGLSIKHSDWLGKQAVQGNDPINNPKLMAALFSDDVIQNKRNTEAIESGQNILVAARMLEYRPAALQAFESVKGSIESTLKRQEAEALAKKDGEARLEALSKGEDRLNWGAAKVVSRLDLRAIPSAAEQFVFRMNANKLPSYTGVELPGTGYALFKLTRLVSGEKLDENRKLGMQQKLDKLVAQEDIQIYLAALRGRHKVEINQAALESKER